MGGTTDIFDLGQLHLHSGEGRRIQLEVGFEPLELGGERYALKGGRLPVTLDVAHTTNGWSLRLRYEARLEGPCKRCLEPAERVIPVDAREGDQPGGGEDMTSPYGDGVDFNLRDWGHDALGLDLSGQGLCRDGCA